MTSRMERAKDAWGDVPEFVVAIIAACEAPKSSQNKVAGQLGYTGAVISQVINNKYPGDMTRIATQVRVNLLKSTIQCPALAEIEELSCIGWRKKAERLTSAAPTVVRMFRACRGCPRFTGEGA